MQVFIRRSLAIVSTGLLLTLQNYAALAQNESPTVSSDSVNQSFRSQQFDTLPTDKLKSRMPVSSFNSRSNFNSSTLSITGSPGAVNSSDSNSINNALENSPFSFGASKIPYSTSRVLGGTANPAQTSPYNKAGKLYMAVGGNTYNYICSASMIGKSLLLTAAHCVHDFGKGNAGWVRRVKFVPAKNNSSEPHLSYESSSYLIPTTYFNGTDTCVQTGVVCNNDIAVVHLDNNSRGQQAGNVVGWFGYGWNGYSYAVPASAYQSVFGNKLFASITQLGYPGSFDSGLVMQINTAYGAFFGSGNLKNTWLGSAMTGGSSGGPWLVNFGNDATGENYGSQNIRNVVVGVSSYGNSEQKMGSSWFGQNKEFSASAYGTRGAGNIGKLVYDACDNPALANWRLQTKGRCL
ncbi:MAG: S1 family peptidase [Scytonematopsis contorta HA4267-MV1]|jgi:hypothetical protein|nr:S1 family peptidase [Scytonematopsis contorta HA4267-MV1]